ncbi:MULTISPECIES: PTS transporter subunit EIIB [Streptococcus]|uniref:PTS transporter subunit EIIB n=1 Tax=Streptococcus TaxID=1301 RepID=UPI00208EAFA7
MSGVAHCATRLRIVLKDNSLADLKKLENVDCWIFFDFPEEKTIFINFKIFCIFRK